MTPVYVGPLVVQSMLLNRRRDDNELRRNVDGVWRVQDESSFSGYTEATNNTTLPGVKSKHKEHAPLIYVCATMWHETATEIKQLFKSIFR